ncbi:MAG: ABC transporter substrate-binding protein [Treponema sp.]|nr:ABC transporter substrate-binding protein [Treponema sp.]
MNKSKIKKALLCVFAVLAIFTVIFTGCARDRNAGELRYGLTTEPKSLDPLSPDNTADGRIILFNIFEGLVKPNTDGNFLPCIAESWITERNSLVYNFTLRENVLFHDGSFLKPTDVKFSLETAMKAGFDGLEMIEEISIRGDNNIIVTLKNPDPDFIPYMTVGIVKEENADREKNVVGTGPFYKESYTTQRNLVLKRFDDYWQQEEIPADMLRLEKITVVFFANYEAMLTSLRSGNIDGANLTGSHVAQLDHRHFDIIHNSSSAVQLLALNNAASPLDDIRVRKAVNYGIDVQEIIDAAFFGLGSHSGSPIIPGLSVYYVDSLGYPYEPDTAKALLAQAGYNNLALEITVPSNYNMHVDTAQVIVNQLEKIGIEASIKLVDWATWLTDVYRSRNYQATIISLDSPTVSPRSFLARYRSGDSNNFINFSNNEFDIIYNSIMTETNTITRNRLYKDAQRAITENAASVFIQDILYYIVLRKGLYSGAKNYPLYIIDFSSIYGIDRN